MKQRPNTKNEAKKIKNDTFTYNILQYSIIVYYSIGFKKSTSNFGGDKLTKVGVGFVN